MLKLKGSLSPVRVLKGTLSKQSSMDGTLSNAILRGYSAYQVAVANGFEGTEEEWLESLKGDDDLKKDLDKKLDINQGIENVHKYLSIGDNGEVVPKELDIPKNDYPTYILNNVINEQTLWDELVRVKDDNNIQVGKSFNFVYGEACKIFTKMMDSKYWIIVFDIMANATFNSNGSFGIVCVGNKKNLNYLEIKDGAITRIFSQPNADEIAILKDFKLDKQQGKENVGKALIVGEDGKVIPDELSVKKMEMTANDTNVVIKPNILYVFPEMSKLSYTLETSTSTDVVNEYHFIFRSGATATTLTHPPGVKVGNLYMMPNRIYEISIIENLLMYQSWED